MTEHDKSQEETQKGPLKKHSENNRFLPVNRNTGGGGGGKVQVGKKKKNSLCYYQEENNESVEAALPLSSSFRKLHLLKDSR